MPTVDFKRITWQDFPNKTTPISAANLNRLEEGVAGLYHDLADIEENEESAQNKFKNLVLHFENQAIAVMSGDLLVINDDKITADHVLTAISFDDSAAIAGDVTWSTVSGRFILNGTCRAATSATLTLIMKSN